MNNLYLFLLLCLSYMACNNAPAESASQPATEQETEETFSIEGKHCFLMTETRDTVQLNDGTSMELIDSTIIELNVQGETVKGILDWRPAEVDGAYGTIDGTIQDDIVKVIYSYIVEGYEGKEEKIFQIREDEIAVKVGELEEVETDFFKLKNPDEASFSQTIPRVDCK